jgi:uncharacterized protein YkwD/uncharacterized membrane protein required for colicin V production
LTNLESPAVIIEVILAAYLVAHTWRGYRLGFLFQAAELIRVAIAFVIAVRFFPNASALLQTFFGWSQPLLTIGGFAAAFVAAWIMLAIVFAFTVNPAIRLIDRVPGAGFLDSMSGAALALVKTLLWLAIVLNVIVAIPSSGGLRTAVLETHIGSAILSASAAYVPRAQSLLGTTGVQSLLTLLPEAAGTQGQPLLRIPPGVPVQPDLGAEQAMFTYVNRERQIVGAPALQLDAELSAVARMHSLDMFNHGYFSHNTPDGRTPFNRMHDAGIQYSAAGENIAYAPDVALADAGLMNSPEHKANILDPRFTRIGIGVVNGGLFEEMFTQDFAG